MQGQGSLIDALIEVESHGDDFAIGDKNLPNPAFGCLQIRLPVCIDVNQRFGTNIKPQDMLGNRQLSIHTFGNYMQIYATQTRIGGPVTDEDRARIWNGGPNGYQRDSTLAYWDKVQQALGVVGPMQVQEPPSTVSDFAQAVCKLALAEWDSFGKQEYDVTGHAIRIGHKEGEEGYYQRVGLYWRDGVGRPGVDGRNHDIPWSAAFISWIMRGAGARSRFHYSGQHSTYISQAIRDFLQGNLSAGYWCWRLNDLNQNVGDILCWSRQAGIDYDHQNGGVYDGHCDIVVEVGTSWVTVIGGNVGDSVTRRPIALNMAGFVLPAIQGSESLFAIMQNRIAAPV
jgi:hypothetical protein